MDLSNKPLKPKQVQYNMLTSVLAQFDIQTQVSKMVRREFDSLMRINKQAFDYIKQTEQKFTQFQHRLSKTQTYYKNMESRIDTKVELTENVNSRLEQFSNEFWATIKESNDEVTTMMKRLDHVLMEKRQLEVRVGLCEKGIVKNQEQKEQLRQRISLEVQKLVAMMRESDKKTSQRFAKQNVQIRQISQDIIKSRSLLESKSMLLTQLLGDLQFYKSDRPEIKLHLETLFSELQNRALRQDVSELRGYVDSKIVQERQTTSKLLTRVDTQIKLEERDRKRDVDRMLSAVKQGEVKLGEGISKVEGLLRQEISSLTGIVSRNQSQATQSLSQLSLKHSTLNQTYFTQIPPLITKSNQLQKSLTTLAFTSQDLQKQISQLNSNNQSINQLIGVIMKQSQQRKEELMAMRNSSQNGVSTKQQLRLVFEKVYQLEKEVVVVKNQRFQQLSNCIKQIDEKYKLEGELIRNDIQQLRLRIQADYSSTTQSIISTSTNFQSQLKTATTTIQTKLSALSQSTQNLINQKLTSIQQQLNLLDAVNQQFKKFKEEFKRQLVENDKLNQSIGQKMERMMAMMVKVKSDWTVRVDQVNAEGQRRAQEIKNAVGDLQEVKSYLSIVNEAINLLLATSIFHRSPPQNTASTTNNSNNQSQHSNKLQLTSSSNSIKITSLLQGWILQSDQLQQKVKYRGENFSVSNRIKFLLSFLEYFVKMAEKIKGPILQNGRDIFMRVIQTNAEMLTQRKRPTSKRKTSELLPKLYL